MSDPPSPAPPRRRRAFLVLAVLALGLAGGGWWLRRDRAVAPPAVDLSALAREVVELVEQARRKVVASPRSAADWGRLGMVLRAHGFASESSFCFAQAERFDPREPRWPYYRGLTTVLTEPAEGLACLRRAVERLGDGPIEPRFRLIEVLIQQGELDEAEGQLGEAQQRDPAHPRGRLLQARLAFARQDWKGTMAALEGCWKDRRTRRQAHLLGAEACQRMGKEGRAEELFRQAKELPEDMLWVDPFVVEVERLTVGVRPWLGEALELARQGQNHEATQLLRRVVRDHPQEGVAWALLGQLLWGQNQRDAAERALARAVEVDPRNVEAWFSLGRARASLDRKSKAADAFREAIRLKPDHTEAYYHLGICLKDRGDRAGARQALEGALRCQPDHAEARKALAELGADGPDRPR